jgi:hypothetical protein
MIDDTQLTFEKIVQERLPAHLAKLKRRMDRPVQMSLFSQEGVGEKTAFGRLAEENLCSSPKFPGAYVLLHAGEPVYVGISRNLIARLLQHVKGRTHFSASLAYRMASHKLGDRSGTRDSNMQDSDFKQSFEEALRRITYYDVAFIEIDNPVELYLFEVYQAT